MPPKTEEEIRKARAQSRLDFLNQKGNIKAAVNESLVQRTIAALGDDGQGVELTDAQLRILENRIEATEVQSELKKAQNASAAADGGAGGHHQLLGGGQRSGVAGEKRPREEGVATSVQQGSDAAEAEAAAKAFREEEIRRRLEQEGAAAAILASSKTEAQLEEERRQANLSQFEQIQIQRRSLPVYQCREEFLNLIRDHQVLVVEGETGSGKTTQLLQYLLEEEVRLNLRVTPPAAPRAANDTDGAVSGDGEASSPQQQQQCIRRLICTQPRRLAATSVAERVAKEMGCVLGGTVGYKVRFDDRTNADQTKIVFMTDGMMLKELTTDPMLTSAAVVMVDEAHERSLSTDVLLGLLRDAVRGRSKDDLRVILASATIQVEKFCNFFAENGISSAAVASSSSSAASSYIPRMRIKGRTFPVSIAYRSAPVSDYVQAAADTAMKIHKEKPLPGDILIFLPGQDDIERCAALINAEMAEATHLRSLLVTPVYASLPPKEQQKIHHPTPAGHRKVVIATNIAETSITVDGIVYVIDCGLVKQNYFTGFVDKLDTVPTSQASAGQRTGRAGRTQPGECYRLYTQFMFHDELTKETEPEIKRSNLASVVLQLKAIGISNLLKFDFLDPPPRAHLDAAARQLLLLGAIDRAGQLTELGRTMAEFPMEPSLAKCLAMAGKYKCANEMAVVAAVMAQEGSVFLTPLKGARAAAGGDRGGGGRHGGNPLQGMSEEDQKKAILASRDRIYKGGTSDMFGYVMAFRLWMGSGCSERWANENFINHKTLVKARDVYNQLLGTFDRLGIEYRANANNSNTDNSTTSGGSSLPLLTLPQLNEALTMCLCQGFCAQAAKIDLMDSRTYVLVKERRASGSSSIGDTYADIHPASYLALSAADLRAQSQRLLGANAGSGSGPVSGVTGLAAGADEPLKRLPPLLLFAQLRLTSSEKPFMCHVAAISNPQYLFAAAPKGFFDENGLAAHVASAEAMAKVM